VGRKRSEFQEKTVNSSGLLLSDDLLLTSRVVGTARDLGLAMETVKTPGDLLDHARQDPPACVIVDLNNPGLKVGEVIEQLRSLGVRIVAYGSHVDVETLRKAREAGCDIVLPRSKFVEQLPDKLKQWCGRTT
jgi:CheY-like chemotaxis protein